MTKITTVGIDLAKSVFQVHGADRNGHTLFNKHLRRKQVGPFLAQLEPCLIGMEACASAHYWARVAEGFGHQVKLIAPQFVKPYVKANKTDAADAEAICEAVTRPNMRFVPIKTADQQAILSLHRARSGFVKSRTAVANQIRGLLGEFGLVLRPGIRQVREGVPSIIEDGELELPSMFRRLIAQLHEYLRDLDDQIDVLEQSLKVWHKSNDDSLRIAQVPGIGWLTATALVASIADARSFKNGRQLAAWLGLVPRQHSSGGKPRLLGISKRGDAYLRTLLIHGSRAVVRLADRDRSPTGQWVRDVSTRRPKNVVVVARANKQARIVWAMLAHGRDYDAGYTPASRAA